MKLLFNMFFFFLISNKLAICVLHWFSANMICWLKHALLMLCWSLEDITSLTVLYGVSYAPLPRHTTVKPLRPGSSGKGLGRVLWEVSGSNPNGDKNLPMKKKTHNQQDKYAQTKTKYRKEQPIKERKMFNLVLSCT